MNRTAQENKRSEEKRTKKTLFIFPLSVNFPRTSEPLYSENRMKRNPKK